MMGLLPYQAGTVLPDIVEATTTEPCPTNSTGSCDHSREVFHIPYVNEDDEEEGDISSDKASVAGETDAQRASRQCKNRQCAQRRMRDCVPNIAARNASDMKPNDSAATRTETRTPTAVAAKL